MSEVWQLYDKWLYVTNPGSVLFAKHVCVRRAPWNKGGGIIEYAPHLEVEGYDKLMEHIPTNDITFLELMEHIPKHKMATATVKLMVGDEDPISILPGSLTIT